MAFLAIATGMMTAYCKLCLVALVCFIPPFLWEVLRPMPLSICSIAAHAKCIFEAGWSFYHAPGTRLLLRYSLKLLVLYAGDAGNAALEALLASFRSPRKQVCLIWPPRQDLEMQLAYGNILPVPIWTKPLVLNEQGKITVKSRPNF